MNQSTNSAATRTIALLIAAVAPAAVPAVAAEAPSAGAIQRQTQPIQPLPQPPAEVLTLPAPSAQASESQVPIRVTSFRVEGNTLIPSARIEAVLSQAQGKTLTLKELQEAVGRVTTAYHEAGYALAYAYLPEQKIADGVVLVKVVEPRYGAVKVVGATRLKPTVAVRTVGVAPGQPVEQASLTRGLILLSQTPGITARGVFVPGAQPGSSDLQLHVADTPLVSGEFDLSNSGNKVVGGTLAGASASVNNPFGYGSAVSVNAMATPGGQGRLSAGGFALNSPYIRDGLRLGLYGSATYYHLGESFTALNESGRSNQAGVDATYPLLLAPGRSLVARADVLRTWLGQVTVARGTEQNSMVTMGRVGLSGALADSLGGSTQGNLLLSHGDLSLSQATAQATDAAGPQTRGAFNIFALQVSHVQPLPRGLSLLTSLNGQFADKNLDSSQKFYLGGPNGVIAYAVGDGGGDDGYLADIELSHPLAVRGLPGRLSVGVLAQYGQVHVNHINYAGFGQRNDNTEAGVGARLSYQWSRTSLAASYGSRVGSFARSGAANDVRGQFWLSLKQSF